MIEVTPVRSKKDQKAFIHFPWKIYLGDPHWVPPLIMDFKKIFSSKHPFLEYGTMEHFLARNDGEVLGRITAITNSLYEEHQDKETGFIGFFECVDNPQVAHALLDAAVDTLRQKGYSRVHGPANPSISYEFGLLVDGFDDSPRVMMTYNPPYYQKLLENYGFHNVKNLLAYKLNAKKAVENAKLKRVSELVRKRYHVTTRPINMKNLKEDIAILKDIHTRAWEKNWGDVPLTEREFDELGKSFKPLANPDIIQFAYIDGKPVAIVVAMPDWFKVLKTMNGRLFPFNFTKLFTQRKSMKWARVILLGTLPEYRGKGLDGLLCYEILRQGVKHGYEMAEGSWILEDNVMMNRAMQNFFGEVYKTYAVFQYDIPKTLG